MANLSALTSAARLALLVMVEFHLVVLPALRPLRPREWRPQEALQVVVDAADVAREALVVEVAVTPSRDGDRVTSPLRQASAETSKQILSASGTTSGH